MFLSYTPNVKKPPIPHLQEAQTMETAKWRKSPTRARTPLIIVVLSAIRLTTFLLPFVRETIPTEATRMNHILCRLPKTWLWKRKQDCTSMKSNPANLTRTESTPKTVSMGSILISPHICKPLLVKA